MTATINASTSSGLVLTSDLSGNLALQSNGTTVATATSSGFNLPTNNTLNAANTFGFKNRIINGAMVIDQRNAGASVTPTATTYTLDRWIANLSVTSKYSVQQNAGSVTPPAGFTNYLGATSLSSYTVGSAEQFCIRQRIEGYNIADLGWGTANAKTVTLSFWVYSSLTGTFGGSLTNAAFDRSYPFSYTISSANTWEQKSVTITGDTTGTWLTTNGVGIALNFGLGVGSTLSNTAGSWSAGNYSSATGATSVVGTNAATFYITGVQLEVGSQATAFDFRDYGRELILCQRYYEKLQGGISAPGIGGASCAANWIYKVTKRTTPTVTGYSATDSVVPYIDTAYAQSTAAAATWGSGSTATAEL